MAKKYGSSFSRRGPDILTEELAVILSGKAHFEFKPLFSLVYANLRARNLANGGEDMFRLRVYEKLQALVSRGMVDKATTNGVKEYFGLASLAAALPANPADAVDPLSPLTPVAPMVSAAPIIKAVVV